MDRFYYDIVLKVRLGADQQLPHALKWKWKACSSDEEANGGRPLEAYIQVEREDKLEFCPPMTSEETRKKWKLLKSFSQVGEFYFLSSAFICKPLH